MFMEQAGKRNTVKAIGGFFELEYSICPGPGYHVGAVGFTSGRACLNAIVHAVQPKRVHLPFYLCDAALDPFLTNGIEWTFYPLNDQLQPARPPALQEDELFLRVNYFGLQGPTIRPLQATYGPQLIVDNTHAFFEIPADTSCWAFNSARKFFGVPDGAYLYSPRPVPPPKERTTQIDVRHLVERFLGNQEEAYQAFLKAEARVSAESYGMSYLSEFLLRLVDYASVQAKRRHNYTVYHQAFSAINALTLPTTPDKTTVPMTYPLLLNTPVPKHRLHEQGVFIPTYWPELRERPQKGFELERSVADRLLCLPLDQRYDTVDCERVIQCVQRLI